MTSELQCVITGIFLTVCNAFYRLINLRWFTAEKVVQNNKCSFPHVVYKITHLVFSTVLGTQVFSDDFLSCCHWMLPVNDIALFTCCLRTYEGIGIQNRMDDDSFLAIFWNTSKTFFCILYQFSVGLSEAFCSKYGDASNMFIQSMSPPDGI